MAAGDQKLLVCRAGNAVQQASQKLAAASEEFAGVGHMENPLVSNCTIPHGQ